MTLRTFEYLGDPALRELYLPGIVAALAIVAQCSLLSVLVVLKRLAFIGQGVSHAAFGGIGVAAVLGLTATQTAAAPYMGIPQFGVVLVFCLGAALLVGLLSDRSEPAREDTAIGIVLVVSMAVGAVLLSIARTGLAWEGFLFGSLFNVTWADAAIAWGMAVCSVGAMWWHRREILFASFDESAASAFGVRVGRVRFLTLVLLALATVTAMKLAGVVLATAMLVLPGAVALRLSARLGGVLVFSVIAALVGTLGGVVVSFESDWAPGPSIVLVLGVLFGAGLVVRRVWRAG